MVVGHLVGNAVDFLLDVVGFFESGLVPCLVSDDDLLIEAVDDLLHMVDLGACDIGERFVACFELLSILDDVLCVVSDPLHVVDGPEGGGDVDAVLVAQLGVGEFQQEVGELPCGVIELVLGISELLPLSHVESADDVERPVEVLVGLLGHVEDFVLDLSDRDGGGLEHVVVHEVEMGAVDALAVGCGLVGDDAHDDVDELSGEGKHDCHSNHVEHGVEHGEVDLFAGEHSAEETAVIGGESVDEYVSEGDEDDRTEHIEEKVDERGPLCVESAGHSRHDCYDAGTDVGSDGEVDTLVETDESSADHGDDDRGHDGGTLHEGGESGSEDHEDNEVVDAREVIPDAGFLGEVTHCGAHELETDEEHTECGDGASDVACLVLFGVCRKESSDTGHGRENVSEKV